MSISFCCMHYQDRVASPAELRDAVLDVALELADAGHADAGTPAMRPSRRRPRPRDR